MAGNLSDYAEKAILEHSVGRVAWTMPSVYVGLFTTLPTDSTTTFTSIEPTIAASSSEGNGYQRKQIVAGTSNGTWGAGQLTGSTTTITNATAITFNTALSSWGTIVGVGLFDAASGGNLLWWGPLTASKTVSSADVFQFGIGALSLSLD